MNYYETGKYVFCHGWIPVDVKIEEMKAVYSYNENWREADETEWHRARWRNGMEISCLRGISEPGKTVVCGHCRSAWGHAHISGICSEQGEDAVYDPFYAEGIIAIDACTVKSHKVNCLVFDE